jgi:hypothetical protein
VAPTIVAWDVRSTYRRWGVGWVLCGAAVVALSDGPGTTLTPFGRAVATILGGAVAAAGVALVTRAGHAGLSVDSNQIVIRGAWRSRTLHWQELEYVGWLRLPQLGVGSQPTSYLIARRRGALPTVAWVNALTIAQIAGAPIDRILNDLGWIARTVGVSYRSQIPRGPLYLYSVGAYLGVSGLVIAVWAVLSNARLSGLP